MRRSAHCSISALAHTTEFHVAPTRSGKLRLVNDDSHVLAPKSLCRRNSSHLRSITALNAHVLEHHREWRGQAPTCNSGLEIKRNVQRNHSEMHWCKRRFLRESDLIWEDLCVRVVRVVAEEPAARILVQVPIGVACSQRQQRVVAFGGIQITFVDPPLSHNY